MKNQKLTINLKKIAEKLDLGLGLKEIGDNYRDKD